MLAEPHETLGRLETMLADPLTVQAAGPSQAGERRSAPD